MGKYIVKRILISAVIFILITLIVFVLSNMAPGGPADVIASAADLTKEALEELKVQMGLDKPVIIRYLLWLKDILRGDLGYSNRTMQSVAGMISQRIGPSLTLTLSALLLSVIVSIPLGIVAACRPYSVWDKISTLVAFLGSSAPNFFIALVLIYIFAVQLRILPAQGMYDQGKNGQILSLLRHLLLPSVVLSFQLMGSLIKQTRSAMLEVLNEAYITTARAKGLREWAVVVLHGLRNALIPIVTTIGSMIPFLIGGAVITEQIFSWNGVGSLMVQSITTRDYNTIMGLTVVISAVVIVTNIALDFIYTLLDPRIRLDH